MKIPISKPFFGDEEKRAVVEPLETGWVVQGPKVAEFEARFAFVDIELDTFNTPADCARATRIARPRRRSGSGAQRPGSTSAASTTRRPSEPW